VPDKTLSGSDSRLPPQTDEGGMARTEASVSMLLRRRFEDEASVRMLALSVSRLLAVAELYVLGCASDRWRGMAEAVMEDGAGEEGGNWCVNMTCWPLPLK
jgi:hypothetical protein